MVVAPCLTVKPHPDWSLVIEPSVYIYYEILRFAIFLNEKLDLWLFPFWPFSTVLSHLFFGQECLIETPESVWVPSPPLGLLELGAAGILVVLSHLLDPSNTFLVPASIPLCLSRLYGVGCVDF